MTKNPVAESTGAYRPMFEGLRLRDEGIAKVEANNEEWRKLAFSRACVFVASRVGGEYTGERIRDYVTAFIGPPKHHNAWGALIRRLVQRKVITPTGKYEPMHHKEAHARVNAVYTTNVV